MRQLVYISSAAPGATIDPGAILATSRRNNARDGLTGLLWYDGRRFLQALEGEGTAVEQAVGRIRGDARHRAIVVLSDRAIEAREFGEWSMDRRGLDCDDRAIGRIDRLCAGAAPEVRATFEGFARVRRPG